MPRGGPARPRPIRGAVLPAPGPPGPCHDENSAEALAPGGGTTSGHEGGNPPDPAAAAPEREPDPRYTLANERTFLAWNRTALALVVAGLGIIQLLPPFKGVPWGRHLLGIPLVVLGALVSVTAYLEWQRNQAAMRRGTPMPRSVLPRLLAIAIAAVAVASAVVLLLSAAR
jgi:putative membrane protein